MNMRSALVGSAILFGLCLVSCGSGGGGVTGSGLDVRDLVVRQSTVSKAANPPSTEQLYTVLRLMQGMFNAAPGASLLNQLGGLLAGGMSASACANALAATAVFQDVSLYPATLSNRSFSEKLLDNLVGTTVAAAHKAALAEQMAQLLDAGYQRGDLVWLLVSALSSVPVSNPDWGKASAQFANRIEVSYYYSVTKGLSASDLASLQAVTAQVTNDAATVTAAKARIDAQAGTSVTITVGSEQGGKTIPALLGVNAGPTPQGETGNPNVTTQYQTLGVRMVRTHDLYGPLDMSVMYPDRSKSTASTSSYNFFSSDTAYDAIIAGGFEPYFRLGDSYNNVTPPVNAAERANWAAAATYIVGRYLGRGTFRYVEIGNEPDYEQFWPAPRTIQEFFDLYARTAKAIKAAYPNLKVGGPGFTQNCFKKPEGQAQLSAFLAYVKANNAPLDFLSWHQYSNDPADYTTGAAYIRQQLDANGFTATENHITEWNTDERNDNPADVRLGGKGAAIITGSWINLVKSGVQQSLFFRGNDTSMNMTTFYGLLYANGSYKRNGLAFSLWSRTVGYPVMLDLTASLAGSGDLSKLQLLAGKNSAGNKALLLANTASTPFSATVGGLNAPLKVRTVSDAGTTVLESTQYSLTIAIPAYSAVLISSDGL